MRTSRQFCASLTSENLLNPGRHGSRNRQYVPSAFALFYSGTNKHTKNRTPVTWMFPLTPHTQKHQIYSVIPTGKILEEPSHTANVCWHRGL
jgi:hypothetical protein